RRTLIDSHPDPSFSLQRSAFSPDRARGAAGLAETRSLAAHLDLDPQYPLKVGVRGVPAAVAIPSSRSGFAEGLRAQDIHNCVRSKEGPGLRKQVVGVRTHGNLEPLSVGPALVDGVFRPPDTAGPGYSHTGITARIGRGIGEGIDIEERVLVGLRPQVRADRIVRDIDGLPRHDSRLGLTGQVPVRAAGHRKGTRQTRDE